MKDSISAFQSNPYGQKSIDITNFGYSKFVKPTLPWLEKPAQYAKPYVAKADEVGDHLLSRFDEKVPILKSETQEIKSTIFDYVSWPLKTAGETKQYVLDTYQSEYKKCGGDGVVAGSKALVTSGLVISSDALTHLSSFLQQKKAEAKEVAKETEQQVKEKTDN